MNITQRTPAAGNTKYVEIIVQLKYLNNFSRTLEILLVNCDVNLILKWSSNWVTFSATGEKKLKITDTKLYVPVVTLSTHDNAKLLQQLKSSLKKTINWNKYQTNPKTYSQNIYLTHLVDPSFQGINRLFVLPFENEDDGTSHSTYVMIDGKNVYNRLTSSDLKTYEKIIRITTGQGDDYKTGCLLNYSYFKNCYKMIATDLSKQQFLDADPRAI